MTLDAPTPCDDARIAQTIATTQSEASHTERILAQFMHNHATLDALAESLRMSLADLSAWSAQPANWRALSTLAHLGDMHVRMTLGRYRITAAAHLLSIATGRDDSTELARRACADLLDASIETAYSAPSVDPLASAANARTATPRGPRSPKGWPAGILRALSPPTEQEILRALESLGQDLAHINSNAPPNPSSAASSIPPAAKSLIALPASANSSSDLTRQSFTNTGL